PISRRHRRVRGAAADARAGRPRRRPRDDRGPGAAVGADGGVPAPRGGARPAEGDVMMMDVLQVVGALLILAAFIAAQSGTLATHSVPYLALNLAGAGLLTWIAF